MSAVFVALLATTSLFVAFVVSVAIGFRIGSRSSEEERRGTGVIEGAVLGLLGLLLAFSFGTGIAHLDARRQLVVAEATAIEVAYSRVDLLDPREQPNMRRLFADYVSARLAAYHGAGNFEIREEAFTPAESIENQIWRSAARAWQGPNHLQISLLLFPALNDMFDIATQRKVALSVHDPALVLVLLVGVGLMSCLIAGFALSAGRRGSPLHTVIYALTLAITIYTVIDLDYPRFGLIRIDAADRALIRVQQVIEARIRPSRAPSAP